MWKLYVHINKLNGKRYYGITCQTLAQRWKGKGEGYNKGQSYFYNAIKEIGWDNFDHILVCDNLTKEEAEDCERYYILKYKTNVCRWGSEAKGYNTTDGGHGWNGHKMSEEERKHLSEIRKGKPAPYNRRPMKQELKDQISDRNSKKVKQLSTGLIFKSSSEASTYYGKNPGYVSERITKRKDPDWMYI